MLCRAMSKPTDLLMTAALRVLAYLSRHKHVGLRYTPYAQPLERFADADWAVRHSQSGFLFRLGRAAVSWGSKKQVSVALSTCEAEIMAASEAAKEAVHLRSLYNELTQSEAGPTRLHLDCKAAIDTTYNPEHHSTKWILVAAAQLCRSSSSVAAAAPSQQQLRHSSSSVGAALQPNTQMVVPSTHPPRGAASSTSTLAEPGGGTRAAAAAQHQLESQQHQLRRSSSRRRQCPTTMSGRRGLFYSRLSPTDSDSLALAALPVLGKTD